MSRQLSYIEPKDPEDHSAGFKSPSRQFNTPSRQFSYHPVNNRQHTLFDVQVFSSFARSYSLFPLSRCHQVHEQQKCRAYVEQIQEVQKAYFSSLVFVVTGGLGPVATTVHRKLASMLAEK